MIIKFAAPTGIAAYAINGLTIHRLFKLGGIMIGQHISNFYYFKKDDVKLLKTDSQFVKLINCDETSMVPFLNFL